MKEAFKHVLTQFFCSGKACRCRSMLRAASSWSWTAEAADRVPNCRASAHLLCFAAEPSAAARARLLEHHLPGGLLHCCCCKDADLAAPSPSQEACPVSEHAHSQIKAAAKCQGSPESNPSIQPCALHPGHMSAAAACFSPFCTVSLAPVPWRSDTSFQSPTGFRTCH